MGHGVYKLVEEQAQVHNGPGILDPSVGIQRAVISKVHSIMGAHGQR